MPADIREEDRAIMQLADELASMKGRMDLLENGQRASQLKYSSIENGSIAVFDREGLERLRLGLQPDGSFVSVSKNNPDPPPIPRPPLLTPGMGTIKVQSQGSILEDGSWPADFTHLNVYASVNQGPSIKVGSISPEPGNWVLGPLDYVPIEVWFTSVNHSRKESEASESATATPVKVVGDDILQETINALHLAAQAVERVHIAVGAIGPVQLSSDAVRNEHIEAGAITGEEIRANTITALNMVAHTITGLQIEAETILGEHIAARQIDAEKLIALSITANEIKANAVTAGKILAGSVTADKLEAVLILATEIVAGNPTGARVAFNQSGLNAFNIAGEKTFELSSQTGDVRMIGILESGTGGALVRVTPGDPEHALQVPGMYIYADESDFPAAIYGTPLGSALGVRPTTLQMMGSLDDTGAAGTVMLVDEGGWLQYSRLNTTNGLLVPIGGTVQTGADEAGIFVEDPEGNLTIHGGFLRTRRTDTVWGFSRDLGATGGLLVWQDNGRLAMYGKFQAEHGDSGAGIIASTIAVDVGGVSQVEFVYGSPDPDWDSAYARPTYCSWTSTAANYLWISWNSPSNVIVSLGAGVIGWIDILSLGVGL